MEVKLYPKAEIKYLSENIFQLEKLIKGCEELKDKECTWIGASTLIATSPNDEIGMLGEMGMMAIACYQNDGALAVLAKSDMGLIKKFMEVMKDSAERTIYVFDKDHLREFEKYNNGEFKIVLINSNPLD